MHVLQLVTNEQAPFFQQQITSLESVGITSEVRSPSGSRTSTESRSIASYARLLYQTVTGSLESYDLIHANYGLTAPAAILQNDVPIVLSLWGSDLLGSLGPFSRYCATKADEVIVMSPAMAAELDVPCHVIPHGIDMELFRPLSQEEAQSRVGWDPNTEHILFPYSPGRPIKDFPTAASVVAAARDRVNVPITLHTLSGVSHELMPYYYNAADAVLLTSKHEGSPNAVREALACNRPVVATDVGDISIYVDTVPSSCVCKSQDELVDGLVHALTYTDTPTGRDQVKETSAQAMAKQLQAVYELACATETTPPLHAGEGNVLTSHLRE